VIRGFADTDVPGGAVRREVLPGDEFIAELLTTLKPCAGFDVSVPVERMAALVDELRKRLHEAFPEPMHLFFGHLGDGNLHLTSGPFRYGADLERAEELVYETVGRFEGSISAEHGVGVVKRDYLHHSRSDAQVRVMQQLKSMLDPRAILNRGRVFAPADLRASPR